MNDQERQDLYDSNSALDMFAYLLGDEYNFETGDLKETPLRFVKALKELTTRKEFNFTTFESESDEIVVVSNIPFVTLCAHHVLPFTGVAHVGYIPNGRIAGLSKLARTVEYHSKGLNVQENLTTAIANHIWDELDPKGVAVVMKAEHTCMTIRGVKAIGSTTSTSVMYGAFSDHTKLARQEFFDLIRL